MTGSPTIGSVDPHHYRTPSLGEIHQELEQEQEAQVVSRFFLGWCGGLSDVAEHICESGLMIAMGLFRDLSGSQFLDITMPILGVTFKICTNSYIQNRLLQMIRTQQQHLQQLQAQTGQSHGTPPVIDESTPTSERSMSFSNPTIPQQSSTSTPRSPSAVLHPRSSFDLARVDLQQRRSRTPSRTASPRLRSTSISGEGGDTWSLGGRDESAFYQAETQMMIRENQMLRQRIRELGTSKSKH